MPADTAHLHRCVAGCVTRGPRNCRRRQDGEDGHADRRLDQGTGVGSERVAAWHGVIPESVGEALAGSQRLRTAEVKTLGEIDAVLA